MVAVFTGNALGFFDSSLADLGQSLSGAGGRNQHGVNAATGNLILAAIDESLTARGMTVAAQRYYNSMGLHTGPGGSGADAWRTGLEKELDLSGVVANPPGGVVKLHDSDGTLLVFNWDASVGRYVSTQGGGAHDHIWLSTADQWIREDVNTGRQERFELSGSTWRLTQLREAIGDLSDPARWVYTYENDRITELRCYRTGDTDATDDEAILFGYDTNGRLSTIGTRQRGDTGTTHQVKYGYDTAGRLATIDQDLVTFGAELVRDTTVGTWSGTAGANDGKVFRTTYTYENPTSLRIASVTGSDGHVTSYTYDTSGRVKTVQQGGGATQTFTYLSGRTDVVDAAGHAWSYYFDASKRLVRVDGPSRDGLRDVTQYAYDDAVDPDTLQPSDNLMSIVTTRGGDVVQRRDFLYDGEGNLTFEWDGEGRAVRRTWYANRMLASIKRYTVADADGPGAVHGASGGLTEYYVYDSQRRLRFSIDEMGVVTETVYNESAGNSAEGLPTAIRRYNDVTYSGTHSEDALEAWLAAMDPVQRQSQKLTAMTYDTWGRLRNRFEYASVDAAYNGVADSAMHRTVYTYDAHGQLRNQIVSRPSAPDECTDFVYDGIGRLLHTVRYQSDSGYTWQSLSVAGFHGDPLAAATTADAATDVSSSVYQDSYVDPNNAGIRGRVVLTTDAGATVTQVFDTAGRVVDVIEAGPGQTTRTTEHFYDAEGERIATRDANGGMTYFFHDERGNLFATVDPTGALTETEFDAAGRPTRTITHATRRTTTSWFDGTTFALPTATSLRREWIQSFTSTPLTRFDTTDLDNPAYPSLTYDATGGRIVLQRQDSPTTSYPRLAGTTVYSVEDGPLFRTEVTTGPSINGLYGFVGLHNGASFQTGVYFGSKIYAHSSTTGNVTLASIAANTTYVVELHATETGMSLRVWQDGQDPSAALVYDFAISTVPWDQVYLNIRSQMTPGGAGDPLYVDNVTFTRARTTSREYDDGGLLTRERSGLASTAHEYDGAGRLIRSTTSAPGLEDRVVRHFYGSNDTLLGTLDAAGFLTEHTYDLQGRLVRTTRYAKASTNPTGATIVDVRPAADTVNDQVTRTFHDGRDRVIAVLDAEGYLTTTSFDESTNVRTVRRYATDTTPGGSASLASLLAAVGTSNQQTQEIYDSRGRLDRTIDHHGTITKYYYDHASRLVRTEVAQGQPEVRNGEKLYDVFGNLVAEMDPANAVDALGVRRLSDTMTFAQKVAVFTAWGTRHAYDVLGRRKESIDAEGNATWYFYDAAGRQTFVARGRRHETTGLLNDKLEITETRYTAFGQVSDTITYAGTPTNATRNAAGAAAIIQTIATYADTAVDSRDRYFYDTRGLLIQHTDAMSGVSVMRHDALGQQVSRTTAYGTSTASTTTTAYDVRGLLTATTEASGTVVQRTLEKVYDAFGRVTSDVDGRDLATTFAYDRLGRQLSSARLTYTGITGAYRNEQPSTSYDAYGRVLTVRTATGHITTYDYDDTLRKVTVTTPEGLVTVTEQNRHGETIKLTAPGGAVTTYEYDTGGRVEKVTGPTGAITTSEYTVRGLLYATVSASGTRVQYTYDAAGRVLTRTEDQGAGKLNRVTKWTYDAFGRAVTETDPSGRVVKTSYDRESRTTLVQRDPDTLNLRTAYTWDANGRQLSVTEGYGTTDAVETEYEYDALGRRIRETIAPDTLALTTLYTYDAADNVVSKVDANGIGHAYAYDQADRLVYVMDTLHGPGDPTPTVAVTRHYYDEAGLVTATRRYADALTLTEAQTASLVSATGGTMLATLNGLMASLRDDTRDQVQFQVRDGDGRVRYLLTQSGATKAYVVETRYDAFGNAHHQRTFPTEITLSTTQQTEYLMQDDVSPATILIRLDAITSAVSTQATSAPQSYQVFDAAGRSRFSVALNDAGTGVVVERQFDAAGRVVAEIRHALTVPFAPTATVATVASQLAGATSAQIRTTRFAYDALDRLRYTIDDLGYATSRAYDEAGRLSETRRYSVSIAPADYAEATITAALSGKSNVRDALHAYDDAGRLERTTDALGGYERFVYDAADHRKEHYDKLGRKTTFAYDDAGRVVSTTDALNQVEAFEYDGLGNRTVHTDALGRETTHVYDSRGNVVKIIDALLNYETFGYDTLGNRTTHVDRNGHTTTTSYDQRGNATRVVDALGADELYTYDAAGRRKTYTDKLDGVRSFIYDRLGRLIEEKAPTAVVYRYEATTGTTLQAVTTQLSTKTTYDAWGNVATVTENAGAATAEQRTVTYAYDRLNRQIRTTFPRAWQVGEGSLVLEDTVAAPTIEVTYDGLGRAIKQEDARGFFSYKVYDALDRVIHEIDGGGYVTSHTYDAAGQETALIRRAARLAPGVPTGWETGAAITNTQWTSAIDGLSKSGNRVLVTTWDAVGRKQKVETFGQNSDGTNKLLTYYDNAGVQRTGTPTTEFVYDAAGRLVKELVLTENSTKAETWHWYDAAGRRTHTLDAEKYLTRYTYDDHGNVTQTREYARRITGTPVLGTPPAIPAVGDLATGYDRTVTTKYDALHRKIEESAGFLSQSTSGGNSTQTLVTEYEYDAAGHRTAVEVDDVRTENEYDALGRLVGVKEHARDVLKSTWAADLKVLANTLDTASLYESINPYTRLEYDAFGNVVHTFRADRGAQATGTNPSGQHAYNRYDRQGRVVVAIDGTGQALYTMYNAADQASVTFYDLAQGQGGTPTRVKDLYSYDALGRQIEHYECHVVGGVDTAQGAEAVVYNAFGEITTKAWIPAHWSDTSKAVEFVYDDAGNQIQDDAPGAVQRYRYNLAGQQVGQLRNPNSTVMTRMEVDKLGRATKTVLPSHTADATVTTTMLRTFDRWGNVTAETDPRGNTTTREFNGRNQLTVQTGPTVSVMGEDGQATNVAPKTRWFYDVHGRTIGTKDANGGIDLNVYDATGRLISTINAVGDVTTFAYDVFGRELVQRDGTGYMTTTTYDRADRVTAIGDYVLDPATGGARLAKIRESYVLNRNGDRIRVSNAFGHTQRFDFDARGLLLRSETATGVVNTYGYDWSGNKVSEANELGHTQTWTYDIHGRVRTHKDLGGNDYTYAYDDTGARSQEASAELGLVRDITYFANGLVKRIQLSASDYTEYQYDANGNRTYERTFNTAAAIDVVNTITYDSHNRVIRVVTDDRAPATDVRILDLSYTYDAVGNRRSVVAHSGYGPGAASLSPTPPSSGTNKQESWYLYDAENRVVLVNGVLDPVTHVIGIAPSSTYNPESYRQAYDGAGRVTYLERSTGIGPRYERTTYTERGERLLDTTQHGTGAIVTQGIRTYDDAGRLIRTVSKFGPNSTAKYYYYEDGNTLTFKTVNLAGAVASATEYTYDADGRIATQTTYGRRANQSSPWGTPIQNPNYNAMNTAAEWLASAVQLPGTVFLDAAEFTYAPGNHTLTKLDEVRYNAAGDYDVAGRLYKYRYQKFAASWQAFGSYTAEVSQLWTHTYTHEYLARDGYLEQKVTGESSNTNYRTSSTTSTYDAAGRRTQIIDWRDVPGPDNNLQAKRDLAYNADGQILRQVRWYYDSGTWKQGKDEVSSANLYNKFGSTISTTDWNNTLTDAQRESWYDKADNTRATYVNGQQVATHTEAGTEFNATGQLTGFSNTSMGRTQVQVAQGDTLKSLAQRIYGSEVLWYVLADANGLSSETPLAAGTTLNAPEVKTTTNDATTFKPYDPSEITGPTSPAMAYMPPPDQGCGTIGMILMVVAAVAVSIFTAGALSGLAAAAIGQLGSAALVGAIAGAAASTASQIVGNMTGVVDGFSMKDIAIGAVTGAVGGALSYGLGAAAKSTATGVKATNGITRFATYTSKNGAQLTHLGRVTVGVATYGSEVAANKLMGRDTGFSWKGVAASMLGSYVGARAGAKLGADTVGNFAGSLAGSAATAVAKQAMGQGAADWRSIVAQAIGNTVGTWVGGLGSSSTAKMLKTKVRAQKAHPNKVVSAGKIPTFAALDLFEARLRPDQSQLDRELARDDTDFDDDTSSDVANVAAFKRKVLQIRPNDPDVEQAFKLRAGLEYNAEGMIVANHDIFRATVGGVGMPDQAALSEELLRARYDAAFRKAEATFDPVITEADGALTDSIVSSSTRRRIMFATINADGKYIKADYNADFVRDNVLPYLAANDVDLGIMLDRMQGHIDAVDGALAGPALTQRNRAELMEYRDQISELSTEFQQARDTVWNSNVIIARDDYFPGSRTALAAQSGDWNGIGGKESRLFLYKPFFESGSDDPAFSHASASPAPRNNNGFSVPLDKGETNPSNYESRVTVFQERLSLLKHELFHGTTWNGQLSTFENKDSDTTRGYSFRWNEIVANRYTDLNNRALHIQTDNHDDPSDYLKWLFNAVRGDD